MNIEFKILDFFDKLRNTFLDNLNYYISFILGSIGLILIFLLIYWIFDKDKGLIIGYSLISSSLINNFIKGLVARKRPFEHSGHEYLKKLPNESDGATGSSFPSGHSQNSVALYTTTILQYPGRRTIWLKIIAITFATLVCFSRLYLGVHFPSDVFAGALLGVGIAFFMTFIQDSLGEKKWLLYIITSVLFLPCLFFKKVDNSFLFGRDFIKTYGLLIGFTIGAILEEKTINFGCSHISFLQKLIRVIIGLIIVGGLYLIYGVVPSHIHNNTIFTIVMHILISFSGIYLVPLIFTSIENIKNKKRI